MDNIIYLNALVIKDNKEPVTDAEVTELMSKLMEVIEASGYHMYGKSHKTSDKQLEEDGKE